MISSNVIFKSNRGFFFAHVGWLLLAKDPKVAEAGKKLDFSDLDKDPVVMFQKNLDPWFSQFACFVIWPLISYYFWNESMVATFFVENLRCVLVLHGTWLINSAAHIYGNRPYDPNINPTENILVSISSQGDGWHNWHHRFPYDYASSELGSDKKWNPAKMFIDACAFVGLVTDRKRALNAWEMVKKKKMENEEHLKAMIPPLSG